jgi:hypothetical protein
MSEMGARSDDRRQVEVCARKIALTAYHLFLVVTSAAGHRLYFRGGPQGGWPRYGRIVTRHGPYVEGTIDWDPDAVSVTVAQGAGVAGVPECFRVALDRIDRAGIPYNPLGPNSNTVARALLEHCGLPAAQPVGIAPGFDREALEQLLRGMQHGAT